MKSLLISFTLAIGLLYAGCAPRPHTDHDFFNGHGLEGWQAADRRYWSIDNGAITGRVNDTLRRNQFLWSSVEVKDFYLNIDVKLDSSDRNAGIQFRSQKVDESGQATGYQADVGINLGNNVWGTLYHEDGRGLLNGSDKGAGAYKEGDWNHYEILASGHKIWTAINGTIATATEDPGGETAGYIAFQIHAGPPQSVHYKINELIHDPKITLAGLNSSELDKLLKVPLEPAKGYSLTTFNAGDTVVFAGGTNVSAMQEDGWLETLLTAEFPEKNLYFRNMGWDGDNVFEQFRDEGFGSWQQNIDSIKANVVFLQFGQMESLDTTHSLQEFVAAYKKLIQSIQKTNRRLIILSPTPFEASLVPADILSLSNKALEKYVYAIQKMSQEEGCAYVDLFYALQLDTAHAVTYDGIHLNADGQKKLAAFAMRRFKYGRQISDSLEPLRQAILAKNKIWFDYWRPGNWAFLHGNRTEQAFSRDWKDSRIRIFPEEMKAFAPLLANAEKNIRAVAEGKTAPHQTAEETSTSGPATTDGYPVSAELDSFRLDKHYTIELYASEQLGIAEPCTMRWDEQGRLWVLCIPTYPQPKPGQTANDKLVVLEDRDKDGKADTSYVFADHLDIPLGFELGDHGVFLGEQTKMIFLKDTNNDLRADIRQTILAGFGTHDSHQTINSFTWSPGGELFFSQGLSIHSRVETPWGVKAADRGGIWRYRPRTHELDNIVDQSTASDNPWGMNFGDWGEMFAKSNDTGMYFMNPALALSTHKELVPEIGATVIKSGTIELPRSSHLPGDMRHTLLVAGYYNNKIERLKLERKGSGFQATLAEPLLVSLSKNFRPVDIKTGPDGAIYVLDWFNPVIGHYQASLRDPRRDKTHGRVWRITAKGRLIVSPPNLTGKPVDSLLDYLKSDEYWQREQVRKLLAAAPFGDVSLPLSRWISGLNTHDASYEHHLMEALAVYESHEVVNEGLLKQLLRAKQPGARGYALQVAGRWSGRNIHALDLIGPYVDDRDSRVRLQALVALSTIHEPASMVLAARVLHHPMDKFLNHAFIKTTIALQHMWQPALAMGSIRFDHDQLEKILNIAAPGKTDDKKISQVQREQVIVTAPLINAAGKSVPEKFNVAYAKELAKMSVEKGNVSNGEKIYAVLHCGACHSLRRQGGHAGPDLSAIGSGLSVEDIITEVLWPGKNIKEGFGSVVVTLKNGTAVQGIKVMQTEQGILIKATASSEPAMISSMDISSISELHSAMPQGLTNSLSDSERADLIRFLTAQRN